MNAVAPAPKRLWRDILLMVALIGPLDWIMFEFSRGPGELAAFWLGNGFLAGWLLSRPTSSWRHYLIAGLLADVAARMLAGSALAHAFSLGLASLVEVSIIAIAIRRSVPDIGDPRRWIELGGIATGSTLLACAVSGLLAATANTMFEGGRFLAGFMTWYVAHAVGMVVIGTATLVMLREGRALFLAPGRRWSFALSMLLVAAVSAAVFSVRYPVLFLAYPPLLMAAFRHRFAGVAVGIVLFGGIGSLATAMDMGPIMLV